MNKTILSLLLLALVGTAVAEETEAEQQIALAKFNIDFEACFTGAARFAHEIKALVNQT